jgi:hypothetical protein
MAPYHGSRVVAPPPQLCVLEPKDIYSGIGTASTLRHGPIGSLASTVKSAGQHATDEHLR